MKNVIVHFDFELPLDVVKGVQLGVGVELIDKSFVGKTVPQKTIGNPTVELHLP